MENNLVVEEQLNDEFDKLMKKTRIILISFFLIIVIDLILFAVFQGHPLFIFKLSREAEHISAYGSYTLVSYILVLIISLFFVSYIRLLLLYIKNRKKPMIEEEQMKKSYSFFDFFSVIPVFFLVIMLVNGLFFSLAVVDGDSMNPNYCSKDIVLINYLSRVDKDDVIVFGQDKLFIKRVVGVPGDNLLIENQKVYINGEFIENTNGDFTYSGLIEEAYYFVMGDNRDNSLDSRHMGLIQKDIIIGVTIIDLTSRNCDIG